MRGNTSTMISIGLCLLGLCLLAACPAKQSGEQPAGQPGELPAGAANGGGADAAGKNSTDTAAAGGQEGEMATEQGAAGAPLIENEFTTSGDGVLHSQRVLAEAQSLKLDINNGEVVIVPLAAGSAPEAVWTIAPAKGVKPAPVDSLKLVFSESGGALSLKDDYSGPQLAQRPQLKLTLSLPIDSAVDASLGNGALSIESNGKLQARVGNGSLTLKGESPDSMAEVGNGSIKADMLVLLGQHKLKVGNGGIKLKLDSASSVNYSASTNIGTISLGGLPGSVSKEMMNQSASGSLGSGAAKLEIEVGNGGVSLSS